MFTFQRAIKLRAAISIQKNGKILESKISLPLVWREVPTVCLASL